MKKLIKTSILAMLGSVFLSGCGTTTTLAFGKSEVKVDSMIDILTELSTNNADVGIMDSIMANYYMTQDTNYASELEIVPNLVLAQEQYGIAARQNAAYTAGIISNALIALEDNGTVAPIAAKYGLTSDVIISNSSPVDLSTLESSDWDNIVNKGKLVIGYTVFAPIAYTENGQFAGFDIDLARAVGTYLDISVEFQEINWEAKELELSAGNIDLIWNGMTITPEREANMAITIPYLKNEQVAVIRKSDADKYQTTADMSDAVIAVESGSAGQDILENN